MLLFRVLKLCKSKNSQLQRLLIVSIFSYYTKTFYGVHKKVVH